MSRLVRGRDEASSAAIPGHTLSMSRSAQSGSNSMPAKVRR